MTGEFIKRFISSIILIPIVLFFVIKGSIFFSFFILICFIVASYEWFMMSKNKSYVYPGFIFIIFSFYTAYYFRIEKDSYLIFLQILSICILTDIGGYLFGKIFKGPKLTKISPNKTFAGMFGGYILAIMIMSIFFINLDFKFIVASGDVNSMRSLFPFSSKLNLYGLLLIIAISTASQLGDIIISYFKRLSKIKNTGKIIPGHGGLLDRIDGMIFAFPATYLIFKIFY